MKYRNYVKVPLHLMRLGSGQCCAGRAVRDKPPGEVYHGGEHETDFERQVADRADVPRDESDVFGLANSQTEMPAPAVIATGPAQLAFLLSNSKCSIWSCD